MGCKVVGGPIKKTSPPEVGKIYIDGWGDPIMVVEDEDGVYVVDLSDGNVYDTYLQEVDGKPVWVRSVNDLADGRQVVLTNESEE